MKRTCIQLAKVTIVCALLVLVLAAAGARVSLRERTLALGLQDGGILLVYLSPTPKAEGGMQSWHVGIHGFRHVVTSI